MLANLLQPRRGLGSSLVWQNQKHNRFEVWEVSKVLFCRRDRQSCSLCPLWGRGPVFIHSPTTKYVSAPLVTDLITHGVHSYIPTHSTLTTPFPFGWVFWILQAPLLSSNNWFSGLLLGMGTAGLTWSISGSQRLAACCLVLMPASSSLYLVFQPCLFFLTLMNHLY